MRLKFIAALMVLFTVHLYSQNKPEKWSVAVAGSFIRQVPDPDSIHWVGDSNHFSWQAGYIMFAMEKLWKATGDPVYFNYIKKYVDQQVDDQGNIPGFKDTALDNFLPGYAILFLYEQTHLEKYRIAAVKIRHGFDHYPRTADGMFWHAGWARHQAWVDGVFMGQIFLARYGKVIGESEYAFGEVVRQITLAASHCGKANGLLLHGWDESRAAGWADKNTGTAPEVWSEGLGWYAVLLADVFEYLPKDYPGYRNVMDIYTKLCKGLKDSRDPQTGMWCQVVDKCGAPGNWNETSGTAMYVYLLRTSIDKGLLDAAEYMPVVEKAYTGLVGKAVKNSRGLYDLTDCSSIGIQNNYHAYITQPREVSTFASFGSFIIGTCSMEFPGRKN
jgi:rhamnogalacturonyl hydrolase YesR